MSSQIIDSLVSEMNLRLGDQPFYTVRQLVDCGLFGSMGAARMALSSGSLTFVRVSTRRILIPRAVILNFLKNHISESVEE